MAKSLHVKRISTGEIVHSVECQNESPRYVERVMMGMLRNMNTEEFYIDDSEFDESGEVETNDL